MEWSEEDEAAAMKKYPVGPQQQKAVVGVQDRKARKEERREQLKNKEGNRKARRRERDAKLAEAAEKPKSTD
jgi:tRNA (adenine57-N1/adenine58-N1)-methyltransferase